MLQSAVTTILLFFLQGGIFRSSAISPPSPGFDYVVNLNISYFSDFSLEQRDIFFIDVKARCFWMLPVSYT